MGLFGKKKSSTPSNNSSAYRSINADLFNDAYSKSQRMVPSYERAIQLMDDYDHEGQSTGRWMMTRLADQKTDPRACMWMAKEYEKHGCLSAAANWYKTSAQLGVREAVDGYKRCYNPYHIDPYFQIMGGRGCGTPHVRYENSMEEKQKNDFASAIKCLASNPSQEEGTKAATTIFQIATSNKCQVPDAFSWMGGYYEHRKEYSEAFNWYKKAAEKDSVDGIRNYARMFFRGTGVAKDEEKAKELYKKAADRGDAEAQFVMFLLLKDTADKESALKYLQMSAHGGFEPALEALNGPQKSIEERLENAFKEALELGDLTGIKNTALNTAIHQPEDFCKKAYAYCKGHYDNNDHKKMAFEYCLTGRIPKSV